MQIVILSLLSITCSSTSIASIPRAGGGPTGASILHHKNDHQVTLNSPRPCHQRSAGPNPHRSGYGPTDQPHGVGEVAHVPVQAAAQRDDHLEGRADCTAALATEPLPASLAPTPTLNSVIWTAAHCPQCTKCRMNPVPNYWRQTMDCPSCCPPHHQTAAKFAESRATNSPAAASCRSPAENGACLVDPSLCEPAPSSPRAPPARVRSFNLNFDL